MQYLQRLEDEIDCHLEWAVNIDCRGYLVAAKSERNAHGAPKLRLIGESVTEKMLSGQLQTPITSYYPLDTKHRLQRKNRHWPEPNPESVFVVYLPCPNSAQSPILWPAA